MITGSVRAGHAPATLPAAVAALTGLLCLLTLTLLPAAPATGTTHDDGLPVEVAVDSVSPQVLRPGDDLRVRVSITNTGTEQVAEPRVTLNLDRSSYISRTSLDRWRSAAPQEWAGSAVTDVDLSAPLDVGDSRRVTIEVPADSLGLRDVASDWGPRGVAATVVDVADPARVRLGITRTFALWYPADDVTATRLTVLAPLVGPAVSPHDSGWVDDLEELTGAGGRLADVLAATAQHEVTWALDPWLVDATHGPPARTDDGDAQPGQDEPDDQGGSTPEASAEAGTEQDGTAEQDDGDAQPGDDAADEGDAPTADEARAGPTARGWAEAMLDATVDRDVQLLPYTDPDLAALAHTGEEDLLSLAMERSDEVGATVAELDGAGSSVALPAEPLPDLATASFAARDGRSAVVVGPGELLPPGVLTYTPSGRTTATTAGGDVTVLVPDDRLSGALVTGRVGVTRPQPGELGEVVEVTPSETVTPAGAAQDLLAELAVITRERPSDGRHLLVSVPRDWHPDPLVAQAQLAALDRSPWVRHEPVSALIGTQDPGIDRGTLPERTVGTEEVSAATLGAVQQTVATRRDLAQMVENPALLLAGTELEVLAPASVAWRQHPQDRTDLVARSEAATAELRESVAVQPGSELNLISTSGALPVRVASTLDQPVTLEVALQPGDSRLRIDEQVTVTLPAGGEETVQIPVHAIQSADVAVVVELRTPQGTLVDASTDLTVRVRAEWEGIGTAVLGVLLAVGLVIGLVRTIRRGRTGSRGAPVDSGPDALSPEVDDEPVISPPETGPHETER